MEIAVSIIIILPTNAIDIDILFRIYYCKCDKELILIAKTSTEIWGWQFYDDFLTSNDKIREPSLQIKIIWKPLFEKLNIMAQRRHSQSLFPKKNADYQQLKPREYTEHYKKVLPNLRRL